MRDLLTKCVAAAALSVAVILMACPASAVPGFAEIGEGASDIARNCGVGRDKSPEQIVAFCTKAIGSVNFHHAAWPYFARALAYVRLGQSKSALDDLDVAISFGSGRDPNLAGMYHERCRVRARMGVELQGAVDDCSKSLSLRPGDPRTLQSRALAEIRIGNFGAAISDCTAALSNDPSLASSQYLRGVAERKAGNTAKANADISASSLREPSVAASFAAVSQ